jgi:penicillin-binding protein 1B
MTRSLKLFLSLSCTQFFSFFFFCILSLPLSAYAIEWPFSNQEFQKKLSSKDLTPSIRFYARGPSFIIGQKWDDSRFNKQLLLQNYRIRSHEDILFPGDSKQVSYENCKSLTADELVLEGSRCWMWRTHNSETYLVVISPENTITATYTGDPATAVSVAALDPIQVAQYKGLQPIMQNELKIADFPVNCLNATMAIEDNEFLEHSGLSYQGLTRSLFKNLTKMRYAQGGSTITQQLVKNYFLTPEKTLNRKLKELYLAVKLESEWTKDQILETYLNIIYMGQSGAFQVLGFGAASQYYFNKPVQTLQLSECALLAAIINNPGVYNPWKNPDKAISRRNLVLEKMQKLKLITAKEYNESINSKLPEKNVLKASETAPYFLEAVRHQLEVLKIADRARDIYTSLDLDAQQFAQTALQNHIADLEKTKKNLKKNKEKGLNLQGIIISTENKSGLVTVLVGGQNYKQTQFNRALNGKRQIGSLIKPFVYYMALESGYNPLSELEDIKFVWKYDRKSWSPENYDRKYFSKVPLYFALKESLNVPTARIVQEIGVDRLIFTAKKVGFFSEIESSPASSLGASTHFPIEIVDSFRTLANMGKKTSSGFIMKALDSDGNILYSHQPEFAEVLSPDLTGILVGMMQETLKTGTAKVAKKTGWNIISAGKTGTTSDNKDAWFSGFTTHITSVVWLGYDQGTSSHLTGASGAVPVWVEVMKNQSQFWTNSDFNWPENLEKRPVDGFLGDEDTELLFIKK